MIRLKGTQYQFFWRFLRRRKLLLSLYVFLALWVGFYGVFNAFLLKVMIDKLNGLEFSLQVLFVPLVLLLVNNELHNLSWRGINLVSLQIIPPVKNEMTRLLFDQVHQKPYPLFQKTLSGSIAQDVAIVTEAFERVAGNTCVRFIRGGSQLFAALILMGSIHFGYSLLFLTWMLCFTSVSVLFSKKIRKYSHATAKTQSDVSGQVVDSVSAAKEVRLFGCAPDESHRLNHFLNKWRDAYTKKGKFFLKFYFFQGCSITCLVLAMACLLIYQRTSGLVTPGDFVYIFTSTFLLTEMIWANTELIDQFNEQMGRCAHSLSRLLNIEDPKNTEILQDGSIEKGEISFESVVFSYKPHEPLFQGESLHIRGGEKIGVVGKSGAGKSTLIHLLLGFYPLEGGRITIDGQDINSISRQSLYQSISVVSQNPALFQRSLSDNITMSNPLVPKENVLMAAQLAGLDIDGHYDKCVSELSGGQRQRVAIARAILKNAPILILDEPTSQLDAITESEVKASLYHLMEGKTTIAITHHLSMLSEMDRIIVIDQGIIVEEGTHVDLIRCNGIYAKLWEAQIGSSFSLV